MINLRVKTSFSFFQSFYSIHLFLQKGLQAFLQCSDPHHNWLTDTRESRQNPDSCINAQYLAPSEENRKINGRWCTQFIEAEIQLERMISLESFYNNPPSKKSETKRSQGARETLLVDNGRTTERHLERRPHASRFNLSGASRSESRFIQITHEVFQR